MGWLSRLLALFVLIVVAAGALLAFGRFSYAPTPSEAGLANPDRYPLQTAYDILGRRVSTGEADGMRATEAGRKALAPASGAFAIDAQVVARGREAFYTETFGNEVFLTEVMGMLDGALSPYEVARAVILLGGQGTNDLKVRVAKDVTIGERTYRTGELVATGLDVEKWGTGIVGLKTFYDRGHLQLGITCALCHAAVDPKSGKLVEGAPNADLNAGLLLALATNSSAYFMHGSIDLDPLEGEASRTVTTSDGAKAILPDRAKLEAAAKVQVASWPPGSFDSSADRVTNPTSIPSSFSAHGEPYSWSGREAVGPFHGLSSLNNNVHAANSDTTQLAADAPVMFGLDPEMYLGTILQGAVSPAFRYDPAGGRKPSELLHGVDPTPRAPGLNQYAVLPTYPKTNYVTDNGLFASVPGEPANFANNAMSAFQNLLRAPDASKVQSEAGRAVFEKAGCASCHAGPALTNHRILPVEQVGTEPTRARAGAKLTTNLSRPDMFATDTPFPLPADPTIVPIPLDGDALRQVQLGWGYAGTQGGYKVPNLVGLPWSAPYLHDAGVAVGPDVDSQLGLPGTFEREIAPDPANSLRALVDRDLRGKVVAANKGSERERTARVTGEGHAFWADAGAGVSTADQDALIAYLLSVDRLTEPAATP